MTPLYLNSPLPDLNQQHQFLLSPNYESSALSPQSSFFFNTEFGCSHQDHQIVDYTSQSRFSDPKAPPSSSSIAFEAGVNDEVEYRCDVEGSALKVRVVQKMIKPSENGQKRLKYTLRFQDQQPNYNESSQSGRVCSDCNTTTTPLWRSGPKGPKSLCNACGIRQRKARRAMAAAEAAMGSGSTAEAKPSKVHNVRDKKLRPGQCKKLGNNVAQKPKISFKNFAFDFANKNNSAVLRPGFSQDVEQAALMLMELSCGFLQG